MRGNKPTLKMKTCTTAGVPGLLKLGQTRRWTVLNGAEARKTRVSTHHCAANVASCSPLIAKKWRLASQPTGQLTTRQCTNRHPYTNKASAPQQGISTMP